MGLHFYSNFHFFGLSLPRVPPEPDHKDSHQASTLHKCLIIRRMIIQLWLDVGHSGKKRFVGCESPHSQRMQSKCLMIISVAALPFLLNFLNELQDIIKILICEASVIKLRSQRQRPVPRKWKCHSHPVCVCVCEPALFLDPQRLTWVWLLRVRMRHLINTNPGLDYIWEGTGRYSEFLFQTWPAGCHYIALSFRVNMCKCSLNVVNRSTFFTFTSFALLAWLKVTMIWWKHV